MEEYRKISKFSFLVLFSIVLKVSSDGQRDYGETCSLRSQIANYFRENDSPQGCMSEKNLICVSHKCVCDPTSIYQQPPSTSSDSSSTGIRSSITSFVKKFSGSESPAISSTPASTPSVSGGRCVGRSGSPCLTESAVCVEHAICQGSPKLCRCQGIYSSNTMGMCSKRATIANQALKRITSGITGRRK